MITYVITIKTLDVKLSFSIVPDPNLDDLSSKTLQGLQHVM